MNILLSHPTGNRNVREVMAALLRADYLAEFHTTVTADPQSRWIKVLPENFQKECLRRHYDIPKDKLKSHPYLELARLILPKLGMKSVADHEKGWASVDAVYNDFDRSVADRVKYLAKDEKIKAVYAYEDGALETFRRAKEYGLKCIYELPIAYWETSRKLLLEEAKRLPEWSITLGGGIHDSEQKLERKTGEMELADVVVCPGKFVSDSIPLSAKDKHVIISPFGSPLPHSLFAVKGEAGGDTKRPLRVLFAGSMGQRKGLGDLFDAIRHFSPKHVELVVMGSLLAPIEFYKKKLPHFRYEAGRPNDQVLALMQSCDIFCLPSIVEGRALVMQEAMSQGLPLIITANTGGEDLILHGQTGFLVPPGSPESISEKISWFLDHRNEIPIMGESARRHASMYTWEKYGNKISREIGGYLVEDDKLQFRKVRG